MKRLLSILLAFAYSSVDAMTPRLAQSFRMQSRRALREGKKWSAETRGSIVDASDAKNSKKSTNVDDPSTTGFVMGMVACYGLGIYALDRYMKNHRDACSASAE